MKWMVNIRFKDDNSTCDGLIFTDENTLETYNGEDVFYYVNSGRDIKCSQDPNGVEDFVVVDYKEIKDD